MACVQEAYQKAGAKSEGAQFKLVAAQQRICRVLYPDWSKSPEGVLLLKQKGTDGSKKTAAALAQDLLKLVQMASDAKASGMTAAEATAKRAEKRKLQVPELVPTHTAQSQKDFTQQIASNTKLQKMYKASGTSRKSDITRAQSAGATNPAYAALFRITPSPALAVMAQAHARRPGTDEYLQQMNSKAAQREVAQRVAVLCRRRAAVLQKMLRDANAQAAAAAVQSRLCVHTHAATTVTTTKNKWVMVIDNAPHVPKNSVEFCHTSRVLGKRKRKKKQY